MASQFSVTGRVAAAPAERGVTLRAIFAVVGACALLIAATQVRIPLPYSPVPMTLQTLAVLAIGAMLPVRRAVPAMVLYLLLGALGLPVFATGAGLLIPGLGYVAGFIPAVCVVSLLLHGRPVNVVRSLAAGYLGVAIVLACGHLWLAAWLGSAGQAFWAGVWPFLLKDALLPPLLAAGVYCFRGGRRESAA